MDYRYQVGRGLRQKGSDFGCFDGVELRSEEFDSDEEFCQAIASRELELINDQREIEENDDTAQANKQ